MTTATQLQSALAALSNIAHPPHGLGFNKLRGIARRELASQQLQALVTRAQVDNATGALANWKPLRPAGGNALAFDDGDARPLRIPIDCDASGEPRDQAPAREFTQLNSRPLAECPALAHLAANAADDADERARALAVRS